MFFFVEKLKLKSNLGVGMRMKLPVFQLLLILIITGISNEIKSQQCDSLTPSFIADLSQDPNGSYISPQVQRNGHCCGGTGNVKCIEFEVKLHAKAEGVIFDIYSGAVPSGALFYQLNCGPPEAVGQPICFSGPGPHIITFCKPGNNTNQYRILSVSEPVVPDSIYINDGCVKQIGVAGFDESTITWNSVSDTGNGIYNSYLSCTLGCDTVTVTPKAGYPEFIDFEVCGYPFGGCDTVYACDTVRVKFFSSLAVTINPKNPTICFGDTSVSIEAVPSGGSPPYTYNWSTGASTKFINVNTGTYVIELGDTSGCPPTYDSVTVTAFSLPIAADAGNDTLSCLENLPIGLSGTIQAASGGIWVGSGLFSPTDTNLAATYSPDSIELLNGVANLMLITTGNGTCPADTDYIQIDLLQFNAILGTGNVPVSCKGDTDGIAIATASGNRAPFTFKWAASAGNQINDSAYGLPAGSYGVTVMDSAGCVYDTLVEVIEADSILTVEIITTPESCYGYKDGTAKVLISGGMPSYSVAWDSVITNSNDSMAFGLGQGTYIVRITDAYGCVIDSSFLVLGPLAPLTVVMTKVNVGCKDGVNGSATATPSGGTAPYFYLWDASANAQISQTATGLKAGLYQVIVTDSMGCTYLDSIDLNEPPSSISYGDSSTKPSCYGWNDGTATVFPSGGTPPYTYLWDSLAGNQTTQTATGLGAGTYSVIIFDLNSCLLATPIVVIDPPPLFATAVEIVHVKCKGGANGSAKVIPTGGTGPYTYLWDSLAGFQTDSIAINLKAGTYSVLVYDQNSCSYVPGIQILEPSDSLTISTGSLPVSCKGGNDGLAYGVIFGGTPPYIISWDTGAASQTTDTAFNLKAGIYTMSVTDSNNCVADSSVTVIEPPTILQLIPSSISTLCFGDSTGKAFIAVSGGISPYSIAWDASAGNQTGDSAISLPTGTYTVSVTDNNNCHRDTTITVNQPLPLSLSGIQRNVYCYGDNTAWALVNVSGGSGPFNKQWDAGTGNQTGDSAVNLAKGSYMVTVTDFNGCVIDSQFIITQPDTFVMLSFGKEDVKCFGDTNGKAFVSASGGTGSYTYLWGSNANSQTTDTAFNLVQGSYMVTVTDSLGCSENIVISITEPSAALYTNPGSVNPTCFNGINGYAYANAGGGTPPYIYSWTQGLVNQSGDTAKNLSAGALYLVVEDDHGCLTVTDTLVLGQPSEVLLSTSSSDTICIGDSTLIFAMASGGNGAPYTYKLLPFTIVNPPFYVSPQSNQTYGLRGFDAKGCQSTVKITNVFVKDLAKNAVQVTSSGNICLGDTVEITGTHDGVFGNYKYVWNIGQTALNFKSTPTKSRYYTLTISDDCAETISDSVYVEVYPLPALELNPVIAEGCIPLTVQFKNLATDPDIVSYSWDFGGGNTSTDPSPVFLFSDSGTYIISLILTNIYGCISYNKGLNVVKVFPLPFVGFTSNPNFTDIRKPTIKFTSTSNIGMHYWTFGDSGSSVLRDPTHTYSDTGDYLVKLRVVDDKGCENEISKSMLVRPYFNISVPNAFTPSNSGGNGGRYDPAGSNNYVFFPVTEGVEDFEMIIFNRWGELIFKSTNYKIGWDGYYKGKPSPQEVYVWKLKIRWENGQTYEGIGDVTLFR